MDTESSDMDDSIPIHSGSEQARLVQGTNGTGGFGANMDGEI